MASHSLKAICFDFDGVAFIPFSYPEQPFAVLRPILEFLKTTNVPMAITSFNPRAFVALKKHGMDHYFTAVRAGCNYVWNHNNLAEYDNRIHRQGMSKLLQMEDILQHEWKELKCARREVVLIDDDLANISLAQRGGFATVFIPDSFLGIQWTDIYGLFRLSYQETDFDKQRSALQKREIAIGFIDRLAIQCPSLLTSVMTYMANTAGPPMNANDDNTTSDNSETKNSHDVASVMTNDNVPACQEEKTHVQPAIIPSVSSSSSSSDVNSKKDDLMSSSSSSSSSSSCSASGTSMSSSLTTNSVKDVSLLSDPTTANVAKPLIALVFYSKKYGLDFSPLILNVLQTQSFKHWNLCIVVEDLLPWQHKKQQALLKFKNMDGRVRLCTTSPSDNAKVNVAMIEGMILPTLNNLIRSFGNDCVVVELERDDIPTFEAHTLQMWYDYAIQTKKALVHAQELADTTMDPYRQISDTDTNEHNVLKSSSFSNLNPSIHTRH